MKSVKSLMDKIEVIERTISALQKCIANHKDGNGLWLNIGIDYSMLRYPSSDPDMIELLQKKLAKAKELLEPLQKRIELLDELAFETIGKKGE